MDIKKLYHASVGLWLLFLLISGLVVSRAHFTADMSAFLPRTPSAKQQILIDQISEGVASRTLLAGIEGANPKNLAALSLELSTELQKTPYFQSVTNGHIDTAEHDRALLFTNRYLLSPAINAERMSPAGLHTAIQNSLDEISSSTGLFSKALLAHDPTGELLEVLKGVLPSSQPTQSEGVWMNAAQTRALILLQTRAQGSDLDSQGAAQASVHQAFSAVKARLGDSVAKAQLKLSGPATFAVSSRDTIQSEASKLSTIGTLLVLAWLWLIFRSFMTMGLGLLPVITGALAGIAAVSLAFNSVHGMTLGFGITLIGEAIDYAIYLFIQQSPATTDETSSSSEQTSRLPRAKRSFWPTIRLGVLTSVVGFGALLFSGFLGLAQLGLFTIVGISVAAFVARFVLPLLLPKSFQVRQPKQLGRFLAIVVSKLSHFKHWALALACFCALFIGLRGSSIWSTELGGLSPVPASAQKLDAELRADLGAPDAGVLIVLKAQSAELALQLSEAVSEKLQPLVNSGVLSGFEAPSKYLPSERTQLARQASLPDTVSLQRNLALALQGLPIKADKLQGFVDDVAKAKAGTPVNKATLADSALLLGVNALLMNTTPKEGAIAQWTGLIALKAPSGDGKEDVPINVPAIEAEIAKLPTSLRSSVYVLALKAEAASLYKNYLHEALTLTALGFLAIVALLLFSLRSLARVGRVIMPLVAAVVLVAALLTFIHGSLSLLHLVGLLLVVAVGSNYALFFDQRFHESETSNSVADHRMLCSLLFANLSTVMGFGLLGFSTVPVMSAIGTTVGMGTFLALVLSATFARQ